MQLPPLLRLMRPALAPTAAADVLAGAAFAGGAAGLPLAAAVGASLLLYTGGMVLNDLCDRAQDQKLHPDRPLVVNPGLVRAASLLAFALFLGGVVLGALAGVFWPALLVAALAAAYDLGLKQRFPLDVAALGGARAANLSLGLAVAGAARDPAVFAYGASYLVFIAAVTAASRAEDMEPPPTRRLALLLAFLAKLAAFAGLAFVASGAERGSVLLVLPLAQATAFVPAMRAGTRAAAMRYVFRSLQLIFLFHAACLFAAGKDDGLVGVLVCAAATFLLLGLTAPKQTTTD